MKIRAMRERRKMSQNKLGAAAGVKQEWISKLEDPNYGRLTISTLLKIASAFDCGLSVDFVPFSQILNGATHLSPRSFDVPSFSEDEALNHTPTVVASFPARNTGTVEYFDAPKTEDAQDAQDTQVAITDSLATGIAQTENKALAEIAS